MGENDHELLGMSLHVCKAGNFSRVFCATLTGPYMKMGKRMKNARKELLSAKFKTYAFVNSQEIQDVGSININRPNFPPLQKHTNFDPDTHTQQLYIYPIPFLRHPLLQALRSSSFVQNILAHDIISCAGF